MSSSVVWEVLVPRPTKLGPHDPAQVGPYTLLARIGRGGQGEVYLAADRDGKRVALKLLKGDWDPSGKLRHSLDRELVNARRVAQFVTAKVLDFDVVGGEPYIVSEYIEGLTLAEHVRENEPLEGSHLLQVAMQTLTALEAIHQAGIIHCDFKPANIILGQGGARVIDFGIAQALDSTHRVGEVAGTFPFMAPEQITNEPLTSAVDVFAWGGTMVFAATGGQAFPGDSREAIAHHILRSPPELHGTEEPLRPIIRACLAKDPGRRPTAAQARRMLLGPRRNSPGGTRPAGYTPGVAPARAVGPATTPVQPPARPGARTPQPPPTRVERPRPRPVSAPPPEPVANRPYGGAIWKAVAALGAAVVVAVVIALVNAGPGRSGPGDDDAQAPTHTPTHAPAPVAARDPRLVIAQYQDFWPELSCAPARRKAGELAKNGCPLSEDGVEMRLFCSRYVGMPYMSAEARPADETNTAPSDGFAWANEWRRADAGVHGAAFGYWLGDGSSAMWWEDSAAPVACFIHGPRGSGPAMLAAFRGHGFELTEPVPAVADW
jgi:predicted Ser/Thr protein kinase